MDSIHQSPTCTLGPNSTRCEMCECAERVARRRRVSRVIDQWIARENARRAVGEMIERAIEATDKEFGIEREQSR